MPRNSTRFFFDIIKKPIITDKTTKLLELNQYSFIVDKKATKNEIKQAIKYIFQVHAHTSVKSISMPFQVLRDT